MFKFLKEKLGQSIFKISKKIEEESPEVEVEKAVELMPAETKTEKNIEEAKQEEKKETEKHAEEKKEEKKESIFGKFKKFFKKEEKHVEEGKTEAEKASEAEENAPEKRKEEGEKLLKEIKEDFTKKEEERKKVEEVIKKKEEINKRLKDKIESGKAPSIQELMERKDVIKPKPKIIVEEKPKAEVKAPEKQKPKEEDIIKAIAAGRRIEEVKKEEPKIIEKPKEEDIIKAVAAGKKLEEIPKEKVEVKEEKPAEEKEEKKGFFKRLTEVIITKKISENQFEELFWELEVALLENNVAVEVIEKIKNDLKEHLLEKPVMRGKVNEAIIKSLKDSIKGLFDVEKIDIFQKMEKKRPLIICFIGINGSGKTTTIAKFAALLQKYKFSSVIAASDTFRAAAINQLEEHADKLGIKLIKHDYGADPAAVAFDAVKYAESKGIDVVLIDTAGRMQTNTNLMDEMKKIVRVAKPDLKIFVGELITGNDCVEQAKHFNDAIGIDGIVLSKADVDEKGGAVISVSYVTKKPIIYIGTGQRYEDMEEFDSEKIISSLGL